VRALGAINIERGGQQQFAAENEQRTAIYTARPSPIEEGPTASVRHLTGLISSRRRAGRPIAWTRHDCSWPCEHSSLLAKIACTASGRALFPLAALSASSLASWAGYSGGVLMPVVPRTGPHPFARPRIIIGWPPRPKPAAPQPVEPEGPPLAPTAPDAGDLVKG
jgi:hypothetical protein